MRTDLTIAIDALSNLGGMPHVNNVELAGYVDDFCMYDPSMGAPKGDCICILGEHDSDDWRILQSPGNYVVVDKPDASALGHLGPGSNAVILPPGTSVEHIIRRVRSAVGAARTIHRHAPALLEIGRAHV
mgnify:FL=1